MDIDSAVPHRYNCRGRLDVFNVQARSFCLNDPGFRGIMLFTQIDGFILLDLTRGAVRKEFNNLGEIHAPNAPHSAEFVDLTRLHEPMKQPITSCYAIMQADRSNCISHFGHRTERIGQSNQ